MVPLQFFGQNLHFAINLFAALVFFAVFWLYFDAWLAKKRASKDTYKWLGFLIVSISFVVNATLIEQSELGRSAFGDATETISTLLRIVGYIIIIIGQLVDPLQKVPDVKKLEDELAGNEGGSTKLAAVAAPSSSWGLIYTLPVGALAIAGLYWKRATKGLERHLKPVAWAFLLFAGFELFSLASLYQNTDNPSIYNLVKSFGPLWIIAQVFLFAGTICLGKWVWRYLTERFLSQLFMIFSSVILSVFLLTTVSFTFLLTHNVQNDSLDNLETAANVLNYAIDAKKAATRANAEAIAQNPSVVQAISSKDHKTLASLTNNFLADKKQSGLTITSSSSQVLLRAEDPDQWGDSVSSDTLVRRALVGTSASSVASKEGVLAPVIYIKSTVPVRDSAKNIIGTITVSLVADNTFTDGIKNSTGLDSAIYSKNILSATTFLSPDGKSHQIGIKENNNAVNSEVLDRGETFKGPLTILNRSYLSVFTPLKDADGSVVGMLFIGKPQTSILTTAGHSIELTFVVAAILLILAIIPAYLLAKQLARQIQ